MTNLGIFICGFIVGGVSFAVMMASVEFVYAHIKKNKKGISLGKMND